MHNIFSLSELFIWLLTIFAVSLQFKSHFLEIGLCEGLGTCQKSLGLCVCVCVWWGQWPPPPDLYIAPPLSITLLFYSLGRDHVHVYTPPIRHRLPILLPSTVLQSNGLALWFLHALL